MSDSYEKWKQALPEEIKYWVEFISTRGGRWPEEFQKRMDPNLPFEPMERGHWIDAPPGAEVNVLDVGAEALTILGKVWPGRKLKITAVDPLAHEFDRIMAEYNVVPPVRTELCDANDLLATYGADRFDMVYCRNAMDHSSDPLRGIRNCVEVVKPGHLVVLHHFTDEAETENYQGMHQWNFNMEDGKFIIWNRQSRIDVNSEVADLCDDIYCKVPVARWHVAALRKRA